MKKPVFKRWLFFLGSSIASIVAILLSYHNDKAGYYILASLGPGIFFSIAVFFIRKASPKANPIPYGCLTTTLMAVFGVIVLVIYVKSPTERELMGGAFLVGVGIFLGSFTTAGYGRFLDKAHPPILNAILLSCGALAIPYFAILIMEYTSGKDFGIYGFLAIVASWQLAMGFAFSQETKEDTSDSQEELLDRIEDIGKE
jgi:hypothetical protein